MGPHRGPISDVVRSRASDLWHGGSAGSGVNRIPPQPVADEGGRRFNEQRLSASEERSRKPIANCDHRFESVHGTADEKHMLSDIIKYALNSVDNIDQFIV